MAQVSGQSSEWSEPTISLETGLWDTLEQFSTLKKGRMIAFDQIPISCCTVDSSGIILNLNEAFCSLFGFRMDELLRKQFLELVDSPCQEIVQEELSGQDRGSSSITAVSVSTDIAVLLKKANGTVFPGTLHVLAVEIEGQHHEGTRTRAFNIAVIDNTLNYNKLQQLEKDKAELRKKEMIKDEFLAVASHELKTPIQPILGFALLAKKGLLSQEKAWDGVLEEARRLERLARDILDVSRMEAGSLKYEMEKERINVLLTSIADSARKNLKEGIDLTVNYEDADKDLEVEIDRMRITQVVQNLLGNAMKFTEKGYIKIECKAFREINKLEISISDSGKGLSDDIMPRLFEKFATKGHGSVENNKGTGLGLYICKAIVMAHEGEIKAFNNNDGGALFLITIPLSMKK